MCLFKIHSSFLSVIRIINYLTYLYFYKLLCRLESRYIVCWYYDSCVLTDITCGFLCSAFQDKTSETSQIYRFIFFQRVLYLFHQAFHDCHHILLLIPVSNTMVLTISALVISYIFIMLFYTLYSLSLITE